MFFEINAQISPGDLTKAHADLEGLSNCTKCHVLGDKVQNFKCLDCHKEIKQLMDQNKGYHSSVEVKGKNCWKCHSEHHGRKFRIVNFNPDKFDHNKAGFKLTGKHANIKCKDCHKADFISNSDIKKRSNTYLGLKENCASCHEDFHQGTLGKDCGSCHDTNKFRPAPKFDHNKVEFKLTGKHEKVECIKCHVKEKRNGKDFQKFKNVAFNSCENCHKDVHKGNFGKNCQKCHVTEGFKIINKESFDHSRTRYPLIGKHRFVKCVDCHIGGLNYKPKFAECTNCHKDYHKGQFVTNGKIIDCSKCHNVHGFQPSTFSIEDHNKTKFQLSGGHLAIPCQKCHYKNDNWQFKKIGLECIDCHKNVHGTEITEKFIQKNNCKSCHDTESWATITFDHNRTDFVLRGKHAELNCRDCHYKKDVVGRKVFKFASLKSNCEECHKDIHFGQFKENDKSDCQRCHTFNNWKPDKFDHDKTRFSLKGAHQKLKCSACHKNVEVNGNKFIQFKLKDFKCAFCHSS